MIGNVASVRGVTLADAWRSFRTAVGLGWAVEANWSDPFLFAVYTIAKPLAAALILVVMFQVITGGQGTEFLQFLIVGSALWNVVFGVMGGLVQSILEDRERYRMLKYVVVTPSSLFPFLLGRSLARVLVSFVAVALTLFVGVVFLGVELRPNLLYLVPATVLGVLAVIALGIFMAGWCLQLRQEAWHYPEAIAGAIYLISGSDLPDRHPSELPPSHRLCHAHDLVARGIAARAPRPWLTGHHRHPLRRNGDALPGPLDRGGGPHRARGLRLVHEARPPVRTARHGDRQLAHQLVVVSDHERGPTAFDALRHAVGGRRVREVADEHELLAAQVRAGRLGARRERVAERRREADPDRAAAPPGSRRRPAAPGRGREADSPAEATRPSASAPPCRPCNRHPARRTSR